VEARAFYMLIAPARQRAADFHFEIQLVRGRYGA